MAARGGAGSECLANENDMKIRAFEDNSGDPCYLVAGHVEAEAFRCALAECSDYGEDGDSVEAYSYSRVWIVDTPPSSRWPDGGWKCVNSQHAGARPETLAALWSPKEGVAA